MGTTPKVQPARERDGSSTSATIISAVMMVGGLAVALLITRSDSVLSPVLSLLAVIASLVAFIGWYILRGAFTEDNSPEPPAVWQMPCQNHCELGQ